MMLMTFLEEVELQVGKEVAMKAMMEMIVAQQLAWCPQAVIHRMLVVVNEMTLKLYLIVVHLFEFE
ncbi:unnamed protein product, partial [Linum tenue]